MDTIEQAFFDVGTMLSWIWNLIISNPLTVTFVGVFIIEIFVSILGTLFNKDGSKKE